MENNENAIMILENASKEVAEVREMANSFKKSFALAKGIQIMRNALTKEVMETINQLQGNPLGFKTDKDKKGGYDLKTVKDVCIYAAMNDAYMCGNEVNIIAGNPYLTKEYYKRKVNEIIDSGYDVTLYYAAYVVKGNTALMPVKISIKKEGKKEIKHDMSVTVPIHAGFTGPDAILGKVEKRVKKWVYERVTGHMTQDGDVEETKNVTSTVINENNQTSSGKFNFSKDIKPILDDDSELLGLVRKAGYKKPQIESVWNRHDGDVFKISADIQDYIDNMEVK